MVIYHKLYIYIKVINFPQILHRWNVSHSRFLCQLPVVTNILTAHVGVVSDEVTSSCFFRFFLRCLILSMRIVSFPSYFFEEIRFSIPFLSALEFLFIVFLSKEPFMGVPVRTMNAAWFNIICKMSVDPSCVLEFLLQLLPVVRMQSLQRKYRYPWNITVCRKDANWSFDNWPYLLVQVNMNFR